MLKTPLPCCLTCSSPLTRLSPSFPTSVQSNLPNQAWVRARVSRSIRSADLSTLQSLHHPRSRHRSLKMARPAFRGYAQLPRYQYHNVAHTSVQYSTVPVFAEPPAHPTLEPPTDHPVEKDEEEPSKAEEQDQSADNIESPAGSIPRSRPSKPRG